MQWVSMIREGRSAKDLVAQFAEYISLSLHGGIDLAFLFVSSYFKPDYHNLPVWVSDQLGCRTLVGCSATGIIGENSEIEKRPAMSMMAASLPDVAIRPFYINQSDLPDLDASPKKWRSCFSGDETDPTLFVLLADPFTLDVGKNIQGLDYAYPHAPKVGGLVSGAESIGQSALFLNRSCYRSGMVGVSLSGNIAMDTLVAQGCKPIGKPLSVTRCEKNLLMEIDGRKPLEMLQEIYETLSEDDQRLFHHSLFVGFAVTPFQEELSRGDFLVRNLLGIDAKTGAIALGDIPREGQTIQFHLRDKKASAEDLKWHLTRYQMEGRAPSASGALLFSCTGRGVHLYGEPHFDTHLIHNILGPLPLGGFFCNGEIGAVGQTTFLHGYTSCVGIFRPTEKKQ